MPMMYPFTLYSFKNPSSIGNIGNGQTKLYNMSIIAQSAPLQVVGKPDYTRTSEGVLDDNHDDHDHYDHDDHSGDQ